MFQFSLKQNLFALLRLSYPLDQSLQTDVDHDGPHTQIPEDAWFDASERALREVRAASSIKSNCSVCYAPIAAVAEGVGVSYRVWARWTLPVAYALRKK